MPFGYSLRGHCRMERRKDRWFCNPKGIVSSSPGLPSPRGYPGLAPVRFSTPTIVSPLRHRATTPLGLADTTRFSQGSSRLATLGFGAESLWDSLAFTKGIGSIPSGIGHSCPPISRAARPGSNSQARTPAPRGAGVPACGSTGRPRPMFKPPFANALRRCILMRPLGLTNARADKNVHAPITPLTTPEKHELANT